MTSRLIKRFAAVSLTIGLAACSGGAGVGVSTVVASGIGSGGTGIVAGLVTGFGSVIIDGNRYPDVGATFETTGDSSGAVAISPTMVKMGQNVEADIDASGNATVVHVYPELIGLVSAISAPSNSLTVAGTRVVVNATAPSLPITVYAGYTQFSDIQVNDRVEVDGLPESDSSGPYIAASRIELRPGNCTGGCPVRVGGTVSQLNPANRTFALAALTVNYTSSTVIRPPGQSLANGQRVSVFSIAPLSGTTLNATAIDIRRFSTPVSDLRLNGTISNYANNSSFTVAGVAVNAANATFTPASLALANRVNVIVRGSFDSTANQLLATSVTQYSSDSIRAELHGTVANFVSVSNFQVRGVLVDASSATFSGGTAADLQNNAYVEVQGVVSNNVVRATSVAFGSESNDSVDDLRGVISNYTSAAQPFSITLDNRGTTVTVKLTASPFYFGGTSADLANGKYVTVNAALVNGQWLVNTVTFMLGTPPGEHGDAQNSPGNNREIDGIASNVDPIAGTFVLNGVRVNFSGVKPGGGALTNGARVQVNGSLGGTVLTASQIEIEQ